VISVPLLSTLFYHFICNTKILYFREGLEKPIGLKYIAKKFTHTTIEVINIQLME